MIIPTARIVNPAPIEPSLLAQFESYRFGQDAFAAHESPAVCQNAQQRRGYWDALTAAADSETDAFLKMVK